jgi:hypothetical protein
MDGKIGENDLLSRAGYCIVFTMEV